MISVLTSNKILHPLPVLCYTVLMPRLKASYTLYTRVINGRKIWYYRVYDSEGRRISRSCGTTAKTRARDYCDNLLKDGALIPVDTPTLAEYAASRSWWVWTKCEYLRGRLARSTAEKPAVSHIYADKSLAALKAWILPYHGEKPLDKITAQDCESLLFTWQAEGLSAKTINNKASIYRIMMDEAERVGIIKASPWRAIRSFVPSKKGKGILTMAEAKKLLDPGTISKVWGGHQIYYLASLIAAVTALRQGEILALRREHVHQDHLHIDTSWHSKYGLGPVKTRRIDDIPIPQFLYDSIMSFCKWNGYILSFSMGERPATASKLTHSLNDAVEKIGIPTAERRERRISFHSWRAFANTYFRARGISGEKVRAITRHDTEEMTEHYSAFRVEDFRDVAEAQADMVREIAGAAK